MVKCSCWLRGSDSCNCQPHSPEACCHWNFGARQVHGGSSQDHTLSRLCFIEDGPRGSLHKCLGIDGTGDNFVWNEGWQENNQQPTLSRGYRAYRPTKKPLLTANHQHLRLEWAQRWQTMAHWQHVIFGDKSRLKLYPVGDRLRVRRLPGEHFQQRCQAYRVQAGGDSVHYHNYHTMTFRYAHAANSSNIDKCHQKFIEINI